MEEYEKSLIKDYLLMLDSLNLDPPEDMMRDELFGIFDIPFKSDKFNDWVIKTLMVLNFRTIVHIMFIQNLLF